MSMLQYHFIDEIPLYITCFWMGISFVEATFFSKCLAPTYVVVSPQPAVIPHTCNAYQSPTQIATWEYYMSIVFQPVETHCVSSACFTTMGRADWSLNSLYIREGLRCAWHSLTLSQCILWGGIWPLIHTIALSTWGALLMEILSLVIVCPHLHQIMAQMITHSLFPPPYSMSPHFGYISWYAHLPPPFQSLPSKECRADPTPNIPL